MSSKVEQVNIAAMEGQLINVWRMAKLKLPRIAA